MVDIDQTFNGEKKNGRGGQPDPPWPRISSSQRQIESRETVHPVQVLGYMSDALAAASSNYENSYKGCNGCIAVLGGCKDSTGPPYFAAMSALRAGVDIARIFTTESAARAIRCYSPDLYVHPVCKDSSEFTYVLTKEQHAEEVAKSVAEIETWFSRLHCLVVGSGLGRDPLLLDIAEGAIQAAVRDNIALVLDGDAIFLVARHPALIQNYRQCVITPSLNEYRRLSHALCVSINKGERAQKLQEVVAMLNGPTLLSKGPVDAIANMKFTSICNVDSSSKRCSGQGDVLAGLLAALIPAVMATQSRQVYTTDSDLRIHERTLSDRPTCTLDAMEMHHVTHMACQVARSSAHKAYELHKRSMVTSDIVPLVGKVLTDLTPATTRSMQRGVTGSIHGFNSVLGDHNSAAGRMSDLGVWHAASESHR